LKEFLMNSAVFDPKNQFSVAGKSFLISGATGSLGKAVAIGLAQGKAHLTLADNNLPELKLLKQKIIELGSKAEFISCWPDSPENAKKMVDLAVESFGGLDGVVITNGTNHVADIVDLHVDEWQAIMDANLRAPWLVCQAAGRHMIKAGRGGSVVILSSTRGKLGHPAGYTAYCTSKAGVDSLVRTLACEWGRHKITINAVGPTVFRSPISAWMFAEDGPGKQTRDNMLSRIPLGRLGEPEDVVGSIYFLLTPAASFITGQTIYPDGGYTAG
jgi:NAD(P)-dependent dehydrogenase (short-subunit alcohol dehydrogenase family)